MRVTVEFFGVLRQLTGATRLELALAPESPVADALAQIERRYPDLVSRLRQTACAVGDSLVRRDAVLREGQHIALIPPVSGG